MFNQSINTLVKLLKFIVLMCLPQVSLEMTLDSVKSTLAHIFLGRSIWILLI